MMTHSRPETRPMPVMIPAPWMSPSYMPKAASGDSSRNGEPGSIKRSTRSRGKSLPRSEWRLRDRSSPPSAAVASHAFSSSTSVRIADAFFSKIAPAAVLADPSLLTRYSCSDSESLVKFARDAKTDVSHHKLGWVRRSSGGARRVRPMKPAAAAHHMSCAIIRNAAAVGVAAVLGPLPDVAEHVEQSEFVGRKTAHRRSESPYVAAAGGRPAANVRAIIRMVVGNFRTPRSGRGAARSCRILPLGFGLQAIFLMRLRTQPCGVGRRVEPTDTHDRLVGTLPERFVVPLGISPIAFLIDRDAASLVRELRILLASDGRRGERKSLRDCHALLWPLT